MTSEKNKNALNEIYNNLKAGRVYGHCFYNPELRFTDYGYNFYANISYNAIKKIFCYSDYGSSAIAATKKQLNWLLRVIFGVNPYTFLKKYTIESKYNDAVKNSNVISLNNMFNCYVNN